MKKMTVGELREALKDIPDDLEVQFNSDSIESEEVILEKAERVHYISSGKTVDYFSIYGNLCDEDEWCSDELSDSLPNNRNIGGLDTERFMQILKEAEILSEDEDY